MHPDIPTATICNNLIWPPCCDCVAVYDRPITSPNLIWPPCCDCAPVYDRPITSSNLIWPPCCDCVAVYDRPITSSNLIWPPCCDCVAVYDRPITIRNTKTLLPFVQTHCTSRLHAIKILNRQHTKYKHTELSWWRLAIGKQAKD